MTFSISNRIARFIAGTGFEDLPGAVVKMSKRCLLDFLGVALASGKTDLITHVSDLLFDMEGKPEATVIGEGRKLPVLHAALINGIKGHTLDMDDGNRYGNVHPAVVVFPAALSLAEQQNIGGKEFIASVVAGYEATVYLAKIINPEHLRRGFHTTANTGAFGAAAACSKILGLDLKQVENALAIAGLCGGGLLEVLNSGQMMKPYQTARAAQAGLMAALLAKGGSQGPVLAFEGEKGFFRAYTDKKIGLEDFDGLGRDFEILNTYFKRYSACRHIHSALDAVEDMLKTFQLSAKKITGVEVETYSIAFNLTGHRTTETSEIAAKFSMPVSIALMLAYGTLDPYVFSGNSISSPLVQSLADKVVVRVDPERDARYPEQRGAKVTITSGGQSYEKEVNYSKGEPESPITDEELGNKFHENAGRLFPINRVREIEENVLRLENINTSRLVEALAG